MATQTRKPRGAVRFVWHDGHPARLEIRHSRTGYLFEVVEYQENIEGSKWMAYQAAYQWCEENGREINNDFNRNR